MRRLLRALTRRLYGWTHPGAPPAYMRVVYASPRPVVVISAGDSAWPIDWQTPVCLEPPLHAVSLRDGRASEVVRRTGCFAINHVEDPMPPYTLVPAREIAAMRVQRALGWMECRVQAAHSVGTHTLYLGEVVHLVPPPEGAPSLAHQVR